MCIQSEYFFWSRSGEHSFPAIFNLYAPTTIAACLQHDRADDPVPGIKNKDGKSETRGHARRIVTITERELALFAKLFEDCGYTSTGSSLATSA